MVGVSASIHPFVSGMPLLTMQGDEVDGRFPHHLGTCSMVLMEQGTSGWPSFVRSGPVDDLRVILVGVAWVHRH